MRDFPFVREFPRACASASPIAEMQFSGPPVGPNYNLLEGRVHEASIYRRNGGCGVVVDAKLYVWGGEGAELRSVPEAVGSDDSDSEDDSDEEVVGDVWTVTVLPPPRIAEPPFDVYDIQTCTWSRQKTSGDIPLLGLGTCIIITLYHI